MIMSSNEFEKSQVFSFAGSVDYADGAIVSKTVLKKESGNISLVCLCQGRSPE